MRKNTRKTNVDEAVEYLHNRTLASLPGDVARLVYLASTRDYNTGEYLHDGIIYRFGEEIAVEAMAACHQEIFKRLAYGSFKTLMQELASYMESLTVQPAKFLDVWREYEPYRAMLPHGCDSVSLKLFFYDIMTALEVLKARREVSRAD